MADRTHELQLVLRAQVGDREAYDQLLKGLQVRFFNYLVGLLRDGDLAKDVLQDVYVVVYKKLRWLRDPELFRPWMYRLATREGLRLLKRRRRRSEVPFEENAPDVASDAPFEPPDPTLIERLPELLDALSPASRAVLLLHYKEDLSLEEVAETLGLSIGTVKSRLSYGLATIRRRLGVSTEPRTQHAAGPQQAIKGVDHERVV